MLRTLGIPVLLACCLLGCSADDDMVTGPDLRSRLENTLHFRMEQLPRVRENTSMVDVRAVYSGRSTDGAVLAVVFESPKATGQILGGLAASGQRREVLTRDNVVVIVTPRDGGTSMRPEVKAALFGGS